MPDKQTDNQPALQPPDRLMLWICHHCEAPRLAGSSAVCKVCGVIARDEAEYARVDSGVATDLDPADMTDGELRAATEYHQKQAARYSNEDVKVWRLRLRMGHPQPIDEQMFAELNARRAAVTAPTPIAAPQDISPDIGAKG